MDNFSLHSQTTVEDFLQTAIFLDDEATFDLEVAQEEEEVPSVLTTPGRVTLPEQSENDTNSNNSTDEETDSENDNKDENIADSDTTNEDIIEQNDHILDAKEITNSFMEKGIICSVIKCEKDTYDSQEDNFIKLMKNADIIVLDWNLFNDGGERVTKLIQKLISIDNELHEVRSLIIYTANDLSSVKKKLEEISVNFDENAYISNNTKYTIISLLSKESKDATESRKVTFSELPTKCIYEFTKSFQGIIPNVAMASISTIRKNTHKLLSVLNKNLDIAYLSHRTLLPNTEDAEKHLEEIITSEIESIIHESNVGDNAKYDIIKDSKLLIDKKYEGKEFIECLEKGVGNIGIEEKKINKSVKKCYTNDWYGEEAESKKAEEDLVKLTTLQTKYTKNNVPLTLGVIIKEENSENIFLCLQPKCDSVRLSTNTDFILLLLKKSTDKFDLLCGDHKYKIKYNKENRKTISFKVPQGSSSITFNDENNYIAADEKKYKYMASLKKMQAQRIANEYASYISRVGLNESEYLRRNR